MELCLLSFIDGITRSDLLLLLGLYDLLRLKHRRRRAIHHHAHTVWSRAWLGERSRVGLLRLVALARPLRSACLTAGETQATDQRKQRANDEVGEDV